MASFRKFLDIMFTGLWIITCPPIYSQFYHVGEKDGLADLTVNAIAQDSLGIIYFGTEHGLSIYDGITFENCFAGPDSAIITDNTIYALHADKNNRLWIGNSTGIDVYNRKTNTFRNYKISSTNYTVFTFFEDSRNIIWIGTYGAGLHYYDSEKDSIINIAHPLLNGVSISSLTEDTRGNIWLGTEKNGLFYLNKNNHEVSAFSDGIEGISEAYDFRNIRIRALCPGKSGNIVIGTYDAGLFQYNSGIKRIKRIIKESEGLRNNTHITAILRDPRNNFWISADGDGLILWDNEDNTLKNISDRDNEENGLSSKAIRTIFFDNNKTLWLGTYKAGLYYSYFRQKKRFHHYKHNYQNNNITSLQGTDDNQLLVGTDGNGLFIFNESLNYLVPLRLQNEFPASNILCIHQDSLGQYWIGTFINGVFLLNKSLGPEKKYTVKNSSLTCNDIRSIVTNNKYVYLATNGGGLFTYNRLTKEFTIYSTDQSNPDSGIISFQLNTLMMDSRNYLWMGSKYGMTRWKTGTGNHINFRSLKEEMPHTSVHCFYEDSQGVIWFGTNNGLCRLDQNLWQKEMTEEKYALDKSSYTFTHFLDKDWGSVIVYSILEDNSGNLWLGTNGGLARFNINKGQATFFYAESGTNITLFNPCAAYKDKNGRMYFGGNNGFIAFDPDSISDNKLAPQIIVSDFSINSTKIKTGEKFKGKIVLTKHINFTKKLFIQHGAKVMSIGFGTPNTFLTEEIEFAYKLQNFDKKWTTISGNKPQATYTNLEPGIYTFLIKARYKNSDWSRNIRELEITIYPPFWATWWFKVILTFTLILVLVSAYLLRIEKFKKQNIKLEKLVRIKSMELLEEKELKLKELENNKRLLIEKQEVEKEKLLIENEMQHAQNEKLKTELELKKQVENTIKAELSASLALISKKNDLLQSLKNELVFLLNNKQNNIGQNVGKLIEKIDSESFFKDDWQRFEKHFNVVYANFIHKLKMRFPNLTPKELRLCAYLKMNLSTNEIAQLSNITLRGVEKSRSRLRKKLGLTPETELNDYILNLGEEIMN